jgi:hypothetical protein
MSLTFDIIAGVTVPPAYTWDDGVPGVTYTSLIRDLSSMKQTLSGGAVQYVGYAPYFTILLSSDPFEGEEYLTPNTSIQKSFISREINFGDYYNSETNIYGGNAVTVSQNNEWYATHTYMMPGTYSIKYRQTIFDVVTSSDDNTIFRQQTEQSTERLPFSWQWYNFQQDPHGSVTNIPATWLSAGFQKSNQLTWSGTKGECVALNYINSNIVWQWDNIVQNASSLTVKLCGASLTWDDLSCYSPKGATWNFTKSFFRGDLININLLSNSRTTEKNLVIKVLEKPPEAYLMAALPEDRDQSLKPVFDFPSPVTVKITPRFTKCGSFPIEKIVWDLGDGSPLLTQRRWAPTLEAPFYYSGAFVEDADDPRNYDVIHTYNKTTESLFCFYPSITAYSSSTSSSDSAAITIGPLKLVPFNATEFRLLQTELTDEGKIIMGQIENTTAIWRADK